MRTNERNRYRQPGSPYDARGTISRDRPCVVQDLVSVFEKMPNIKLDENGPLSGLLTSRAKIDAGGSSMGDVANVSTVASSTEGETLTFTDIKSWRMQQMLEKKRKRREEEQRKIAMQLEEERERERRENAKGLEEESQQEDREREQQDIKLGTAGRRSRTRAAREC
ncbi:hypothetical protein EVAR_99883_1 [Eumeta japonica]|uniref:Uncharacterized protein n=1 Tax=Eumeta variegata TaxID=151549 RepID=A0A4C1ZI43_EUMVA|nr:hypothetical protein EVAR_99883_1 [Eumeta japonica]